jgi:hypothetical protein
VFDRFFCVGYAKKLFRTLNFVSNLLFLQLKISNMLGWQSEAVVVSFLVEYAEFKV